jgi:hypothetical protein
MPRRPGPWAAGALIAITLAGCGAAVGELHGDRRRARSASAPASAPDARGTLPAGWRRLRLPSGAVLPYPGGWQVLEGDPGSASAGAIGPDGTIRAYLNATPAEGGETLVGWARFRVRHNIAEGDRDVRQVQGQSTVRLASGYGSCVVDDYSTSRSRYRELACIIAPFDGGRATVLIAAAPPRAWARERPVLEFAIDHFTG